MHPERYPPIASYAFISDCHSAALVSKDGGVDWCCFHRFDGRPVFARILDWDRGGTLRVGPAGDYTATRRYLPSTMMLETRFRAAHGMLVITDTLPVRPESDGRVADAVHPYHQLIRTVRCEAGEVVAEVEFVPRFDFGLTVPRLDVAETGLAAVYGGADALVFQSGIPLIHIEQSACRGAIHLRAGAQVSVVVSYVRPHELRLFQISEEEAAARVAATERYWTTWAAQCQYEGPYRDEVLRSGLVLKALTNAPTGAIVAAPTTSLPEHIGGTRNWDYRFTWLRDAALELYALFTLGHDDEAHAFMDWVRRTTAGGVVDLQIMYGVGGERFLPEIELEALEGYRGSRPVRVGNRAVDQFQLDAYGYLLDTAWLYHRHGGMIDDVFWRFLRDVVEVVAVRWEEPDMGIWEVRGGPRHFTSSKVLAWVAVDRAIRLARALELPADLDRWRALRRAIRRRVEGAGVDPQTGSFVQAFGSQSPDASTLLIPLVRFLPPDDPRVKATYERIRRELSVNRLVYRYRTPDGLPGEEGAFVSCAFWLVSNLALAGEVGPATALFDHLLGYVNDVGLLSEEIDPASGELLGNFPQAFSHAALIGAALNLRRAQQVAPSPDQRPASDRAQGSLDVRE